MNSSNFIKLILFCLLWVSIKPAFSATYHVSSSGNDANNGLSFNKAFKTIQKATDLIVAGDSVWVYDGYYKGFNHKLKKSGTSQNPIVYEAKGSNVVINQGSSIGDGINIEENDWIQVIGFKVIKIPDNTSIPGGEEGIRAVNANHITIKNCFADSCFRGIFTGYTDYITIENNVCTRSYGEHGIYVSNNSDYIVLRYNSSSYNKASGIQINPDLSSGSPGYSRHIVCTNNIIFENKGAAGFNFQGIDSALIANNLIYNNHNASGITLFHGNASKGCSHVKVFNNTIIVPADGRWGIHIIDDASYIMILNNILINHHSWKGAIALQAGTYTQSFISSNYNLVSDKFCETGDGCSKTLAQWQTLGYDLKSILAPALLTSLFVDPANNNYHLLPGCLAINAGTSSVSSDIKIDLDGAGRPSGSAYDIGCYESQTSSMKEESLLNSVRYIVTVGQNIHISDISERDEVLIYNISGKILGKGNNFPVNNLSSGFYLYKVFSFDGILIKEGKFIIFAR